MDGTPIGGAHASASKGHPIPAGAGRDARCHRRRAEEVVIVTTLRSAPVRIAAAIATVVALASSIGAPYKWYPRGAGIHTVPAPPKPSRSLRALIRR